MGKKTKRCFQNDSCVCFQRFLRRIFFFFRFCLVLCTVLLPLIKQKFLTQSNKPNSTYTAIFFIFQLDEQTIHLTLLFSINHISLKKRSFSFSFLLKIFSRSQTKILFILWAMREYLCYYYKLDVNDAMGPKRKKNRIFCFKSKKEKGLNRKTFWNKKKIWSLLSSCAKWAN